MRPGNSGEIIVDLPEDGELWRALKAIQEQRIPDIPDMPGSHTINGDSVTLVIDGLSQLVQLGINSDNSRLRTPAQLAVHAFDSLGYDVVMNSGHYDGITERT